MPRSDSPTSQGPFEGSRCLAGPDGRWGPATIRRANEDGTFTIEFDTKDMVIMPYWYGVTPAEISFDDERRWPPVFARISPDGRSFAWADFDKALTALGYTVTSEQAHEFWEQGCRKLVNLPRARIEDQVLDESTAYQLFLHLGLSAKQCVDNLNPGGRKPYFKLYWNQTRMGGREPNELPRPVTLDDAFAALGLAGGRIDRSAADFLQRFEREQGIHLPATLKELLQRHGIAEAVADCHPNNPNLVEFRRGDWNLRHGLWDRDLGGDCALTILVPHQGDHEWSAVFDDGDDDARIYVRWDGEPDETWLPTAPGIGLFFWDLAQTGLGWYQDTQFEGGRRVRRTDIGLVPDS